MTLSGRVRRSICSQGTRIAADIPIGGGEPMRRKRTIYFNDARHYYLFVFEPPMKLGDAWRPVDECAGTAVDTFIYGVSREGENDGLFYPPRRWACASSKASRPRDYARRPSGASGTTCWRLCWKEERKVLSALSRSRMWRSSWSTAPTHRNLKPRPAHSINATVPDFTEEDRYA